MSRTKFFIFLIVISALPLFAQSGSPYTRIGIGDLEYSYSARRTSLGGLGTSLSDFDFLGTTNPAGWNKLNRTRLEFGINYNGILIEDSRLGSKYYAETEFSGFTIGFPLQRDWGFSAVLGFLPYSNVSYKSGETVSFEDSTKDFDILYEGRGGISKMFFGSSYRFPFGLSIGATFDYYFGNISYISNANFISEDFFDSEYKRTFTPKGIGTTIGLISPDISPLLGISSITNFNIGTSLSVVGKLRTDTLLSFNSVLQIDTIGQAIVDMEIPYRLNAGLSFIVSTNYLFLMDVSYQPFSNYSINKIKTNQLKDQLKLSAGFEYRPSRELGASFLQTVIFRGGFTYEQTPYRINNTDINYLALSAGASFPLSQENTIDLGLLYGFRGTTDNNLMKENFIKINFGISLGNYWFIRQEK